jgi:hypothetical protein
MAIKQLIKRTSGWLYLTPRWDAISCTAPG